jgi:hypothetical protein
MSPCNYVHVLHNSRTIGEVICTCKEGYARVSRLTSLSISLSLKPELAIAEYNRFFWRFVLRKDNCHHIDKKTNITGIHCH